MKKIFTLLLVAICASCVQDNIESITVEQAQSAKIIRLSDSNVGGSMIIYFDEEATTRVEAGVTRSASTRSGIDQLDQVLDQVGATRIERLFIPDKFEDKLRAEGMHRWYLVKFDADADLDKAAELFASVAEVERVQYNALYTNIGENATNVPSAFDAPATRAASPYPTFSDPELSKQWHYINTGDTSVFSGIKAGADINVGEAWDITAGDLDVGFRVLKLDTSNMKDVYYTPDEYEISMFDMLSDNIKEDRTPEDLLFQVMLDLGVLLSSKIEEEIIGGKKVFNVADGFLYACFDSNVSEETITAIAKKKPYYFVMRDSSMASDSVATNFDQIFATYSPDTERKVL